MRRLALVFATVIALMQAMPAAVAVNPDEVLSDPALEARARDLSTELRCLVCQNQSIDDSDAPLARDLRVIIRERLSAGDSDADVIDFVVARYGEFVLLRPRFAPHTLVLWLATPVILVIGGLLVWTRMRRRRQAAATAAQASLTAAEKRKLKKLID